MWMIVSSLGAVLAFADFGVGNGVLNRVSAADGRDDVADIQLAASNGMVILTLISGAVAISILTAYPFVNWARVFQVSSPLAIAEAGPTILSFVLCLALGIGAGLGAKIQMGLQRGYEANLWVAGGGFFSFIAVWLAIKFDAGTPTMVIALFGSQQLSLLLNHLFFLHVQRPDLAPRWRLVSFGEVRALLGTGTSFFLLQLVALISFRIDGLIVTQIFGPAAAGGYVVVERLFSIVSLVVTAALASLWPAYGEALSRGDRDWVARALRMSLMIAGGGTLIVGVFLVMIHRPLLHLWVGPAIAPSLALVTGFAAFRFAEAIGLCGGMLLNAAGTIRAQVVLALLVGSSATVAKLVFAQHLGVWSLIWITVGCYTVFSLLPQLVLVPRVFKSIPLNS